jgi:hypothetical protein
MFKTADIADVLTDDRSKNTVNKLIEIVSKTGLDFNAFFQELENHPLPTKWYMTWFLTHYTEKNPSEAQPQQKLIWEYLKTCNNESMQRDLWRTISFIKIDDEIAGEVYEYALKTFTISTKPIAVRAHAMLCAANVAQPYDELKKELMIVLSDFNLERSAGLRARAKNLMKTLKNQTSIH